MYGADGIGGIAHWSTPLPSEAFIPPFDICLYGREEPGSLSREALSLSVPENSCKWGKLHRKLNPDLVRFLVLTPALYLTLWSSNKGGRIPR